MHASVGWTAKAPNPLSTSSSVASRGSSSSLIWQLPSPLSQRFCLSILPRGAARRREGKNNPDMRFKFWHRTLPEIGCLSRLPCLNEGMQIKNVSTVVTRKMCLLSAARSMTALHRRLIFKSTKMRVGGLVQILFYCIQKPHCVCDSVSIKIFNKSNPLDLYGVFTHFRRSGISSAWISWSKQTLVLTKSFHQSVLVSNLWFSVFLCSNTSFHKLIFAD